MKRSTRISRIGSVAFAAALIAALCGSCFLLPLDQDGFLAKKGLAYPTLKPGKLVAIANGADESWYTIHAQTGFVYNVGIAVADPWTSSYQFDSYPDYRITVYADNETTELIPECPGPVHFYANADADFHVKVRATDTVIYGSSIVADRSLPADIADREWSEGEIANTATWFRFDALAGETYYVNWNDAYGDGSRAGRAEVSAFRGNGITPYWEGRTSGFNESTAIVALESSPVLLKVEPQANSYLPVEGSFAIRVKRAGPPRTLAEGSWTEDSIIYREEAWYSIQAAAGERYFINWNDFSDGDGTKTGEITVSAYAKDRTTRLFSHNGAGYTYTKTLTAAETGPLFLKVETTSYRSGTYSIRFRTAPPPLLLAVGAWTNGSIMAGEENWYRIPSSTVQAFLVDWNDVKSGDSSKTCDIAVTAFRDDRSTAFFTAVDYGYANPIPIVESLTGDIYLKVTTVQTSAEPISSGTYAIRIRAGAPVQALTAGTWRPDSILAGETKWYSFPVARGVSCTLRWDDLWSGGLSPYGYTCWCYVSAYLNSSAIPIFTETTSGYSPGMAISPSADGVVLVKVIAYAGSVGTYSFCYSSP